MNGHDIRRAIGQIQVCKTRIYRILSNTKNCVLTNGDRQQMREELLRIELGLLLIEEAAEKNLTL